MPGGNPLPEGHYECSSERAKRVLGLTFRGKEETFVELGRQLLEIERGQCGGLGGLVYSDIGFAGMKFPSK